MRSLLRRPWFSSRNAVLYLTIAVLSMAVVQEAKSTSVRRPSSSQVAADEQPHVAQPLLRKTQIRVPAGAEPRVVPLLTEPTSGVARSGGQKRKMKEEGRRLAARAPAAALPGATYNGGKVLTRDISVYLIWYGDWSNGSDRQILRDFVDSFSPPAGSWLESEEQASVQRWWGIATLYFDTQGKNVSSQIEGSLFSPVKLGGEAFDRYSLGPNLLDDVSDPIAKTRTLAPAGVGNNGAGLSNGSVASPRLASIVTAQLNAGALPTDEWGIYIVLGSPDVRTFKKNHPTYGGFCQVEGYCGFHSSGTIDDTDATVQFAFVGNAIDQCPGGCIGFYNQYVTTPNGNAGVDGMVSIVGHEIVEGATDPTTQVTPPSKNT
eukprot:jgi/Mesen1/586/ME000107S10823